jgi:uncharacterized protein (TIGR03545 family)
MTKSTAKKSKGPFRTEAILPALILFAVIAAYFRFFFDGHLRRGAEYAATQLHGAEVNIGSLRTSFFNASLRLQKLEVTDKHLPARNLFELGEIRFGLSWDALLRAKAVIEDAALLDIRAHTQRRRPGRVLPPPRPEDSMLGRLQTQVVRQTRERLHGNFLGDIAQVVGGVDPREQLKNIQAEIKSQARALELEKELTAKKSEWEQRIRELPRPKDIREIEGRIRELDLKTRNPIELAQNLKRAREILAEAEEKAKAVEQSQRDFALDIQTYANALSEIEKMARQDVQDLQRRLQIPSLDPREFSTQLFLSQVEDHLVSLRKAEATARRFLPKEKGAPGASAEPLMPRPRGSGVSFQFPAAAGYPLFWLKRAEISSELGQSELAGRLAGEITDVSSDPSVVKKPARFKVAGDFPKQKILGFSLHGAFDFAEGGAGSLKLGVDSFPAGEVMFSRSPELTFGFQGAEGSIALDAELREGSLSVGLRSRFAEPQFLLEAKNLQVQEILAGALQGIRSVNLSAKATGSWDKLRLEMDSNLGRELSAAFQRQLQAKLAEAKAGLEAIVEEKAGPAKRQAQEQLSALRAGPGKGLERIRSEIEEALSQARASALGPGGQERGRGILPRIGF